MMLVTGLKNKLLTGSITLVLLVSVVMNKLNMLA